ncbi:hypothetical protein EJ04DRAFT_512903 [Polyplosphaeria fusca]|uniref:Uncharacterized protein n=1 Tax=Polyplosphaeria fusca TaxID=682080 RepID=A0A9P4QWC4_9PLEO|nr:hypothetical protein EJ04DRAFT_512903 [Polyplosphaeria fusca]
MGSNDRPPSHVPSSYHAISMLLLGIGGLSWTITYLLIVRQSLRDRTYSMPMFSLAFNFAWEIVFAIYIAEVGEEKAVFGVWLVIDLGLVYTMIKYGENEWRHAPAIGRNIGKIFALLVLWWCWALWAICVWWVDESNPVKPKQGKLYRGVEGPDTTELGYWTALVAQVVLSAMYLSQIIIRGHSGGSSYAIWFARFIGSAAGLNLLYVYCYLVWPEAHDYVASQPSICLLATWVLADIAYVVLLRKLKKNEVGKKKSS